MRRSLFEQHLNTRWSDSGTLFGITHHSFFCLTSELSDVDAAVVNPFLTEYIQMMVLALAQRASIISLEQQAAEITKDIEKPGKSISGEKLKKLLDLQEAYVAFQNQLLFFEVTPQEQGVELYETMLSSLYIDREKEQLESHMHDLYEVANENQGNTFNLWAAIFAIGSVGLALIQTIYGRIDAESPGIAKSCWYWGILLLVLAALIAVGIIVAKKYRRIGRHKKRK